MMEILDKHSQLMRRTIINTILHVIDEDYIKFEDHFLKEDRNQKSQAIPTFIKFDVVSYLKQLKYKKTF